MHVGEVGDQVVQEVAGLAAQRGVVEGERVLVGRHPVGVDVHPPEAPLEEHPVAGFGEVQLGVEGAGGAVAARIGVELLDDVAQRPGEVEHRHPSPCGGQLAVRLGIGDIDIAAEEVVAQRAHVRGPVVHLRGVRKAAGEGVAEVDHVLDGVTPVGRDLARVGRGGVPTDRGPAAAPVTAAGVAPWPRRPRPSGCRRRACRRCGRGGS